MYIPGLVAGIAAAANPISTRGLVGGVEQVARAKAAVERAVSNMIRHVFRVFSSHALWLYSSAFSLRVL